MGDRPKLPRSALSFALESFKRYWLRNSFSTTIFSDVRPGPWLKQPSVQLTTSTRLQAASTSDDRATSDSWPRSAVLHRYAWRGISESASDRASSTTARRAAESKKQTVRVSRTLFDREPNICQGGSPDLAVWLLGMTSFQKSSAALR